ncbi:hypothetical protein HCN44_003437 [Aphidius gifuensis]|uniref:Uncharacterized protein n=1 Tax=Aphidius gifuensis TaxID=684658 RepID=A0A835CLQ5_APHGI|nr:hypothetical protein HCN44_003437 [Aphidius gifuensis]
MAEQEHMNAQQYQRAEAVTFIESLDVRSLFTEPGLGKIIFDSYNLSNPHQFIRKEKDQKYVSKVVGDAGLSANPKLGVTDIQTLSKKICEAFVNEKEETYFQVNELGKYSGLLWNYVKNKKYEIFKIQKSMEPVAEEAPLDQNIIENKNFLDEDTCDPWERVEAAWLITRTIREKDLHKSQPKKKSKRGPDDALPLEIFLNKWPSLKHPSGYKLVQLDFNARYPDAGELTEAKLDQLINKLQVLKETKGGGDKNKWKEDINNRKMKIVSNETDFDVKIASKIKLLSFLMPPHDRANKLIKTTVVDVHKSMILHVQTADAINNAIMTRSRMLKSLNKNLQPTLTVVGVDFDHLDEFICCINNVKWKCDDFLTAFDRIFKSYFVLDVNYPYESEVIWGVIQRHLYQVDCNVPSENTRWLVNLSCIDDIDEVDYTPENNHEEINNVQEIVDNNNNPQGRNNIVVINQDHENIDNNNDEDHADVNNNSNNENHEEENNDDETPGKKNIDAKNHERKNIEKK